MAKVQSDNSDKALEKLQLELKDTLESLCRGPDGGKNLEVVAFGSRHNDARIMFRVYDEPSWLAVVARFLQEEEGAGWYSFIGKKFLLKDGKMVFAWNLVLESEELDATVQKVRKIFTRVNDEIRSGSARNKVEVGPAIDILPANMAARVSKPSIR